MAKRTLSKPAQSRNFPVSWTFVFFLIPKSSKSVRVVRQNSWNMCPKCIVGLFNDVFFSSIENVGCGSLKIRNKSRDANIQTCPSTSHYIKRHKRLLIIFEQNERWNMSVSMSTCFNIFPLGKPLVAGPRWSVRNRFPFAVSHHIQRPPGLAFTESTGWQGWFQVLFCWKELKEPPGVVWVRDRQSHFLSPLVEIIVNHVTVDRYCMML